MHTLENPPLVSVYFLRHLESEQNRDGYGDSDTGLTKSGMAVAEKQATLINDIGIDNICCILSGTLKRHDQTLTKLVAETGYVGKVITSPLLDAVFSGHLFENPPDQTERRYNLGKFNIPGERIVHAELPGELVLSFDPKQSGVYPFDPLYSRAYFDRDIRQVVFPREPSLASFTEIEERVRALQDEIISHSREFIKRSKGSRPLNIVAISSCSTAGFCLEYSAFGSIGNHMYSLYGTQGKALFPLGHDEAIVMAYAQDDYDSASRILRPVEGRITIEILRGMLR